MTENGTIYISSGEAARQWGISDRRVRTLCAQGLIVGAQRVGKLWKIPQSAPKPADGRHQLKEGVPSVLRGVVAEVDALKAELAAKRPLSEGELAHLQEAFLVEYTHASTAIEGNTLTLSETALALSGVTIGEKPLRDHLEVTGHRDAFLFLEEIIKERRPLTESLICQFHALVLADKPQDRGVYRRIPVIITGAVHTPPQPYMVQPLMEAWVRDIVASKKHPLVIAAESHLRFEAIHPFVDGNGRTGRLLANFILMRAGYLPISIKYENRRAYYEAFTAYHRDEDIVPMLRIIVESECARLREYIAAVM